MTPAVLQSGGVHPSRDEFAALARGLDHRAGVVRAAGGPHHAGGRLRPAGPGRARVRPGVCRARRHVGALVVHRPAAVGDDDAAPGAGIGGGLRRRQRPAGPGDPGGHGGRALPLPRPVAARPTPAARRASSGTSATTSFGRSSAYPTRLPTSSVTPTPSCRWSARWRRTTPGASG